MRIFKIFSILVFFSFLFQGCSKETDPCEGIVCLSDGVCMNGTCACAIGFEGVRCETRKRPTSIRINKIVIKKFPGLNNGDTWDFNSNPDIYIEVLKDRTIELYRSEVVEDADTAQSHTFIPSSPIIMDNVSRRYAIVIFDKDTQNVITNEFIGGVEFTPFTIGNNYAPVWDLSIEKFAFDVSVDYVF